MYCTIYFARDLLLHIYGIHRFSIQFINYINTIDFFPS
nr:MAG TPA: hypothetical protein [Caudoviricetes sp.]